MRRIVVLDAGPLGYVTHPRIAPIHQQCSAWLEGLIVAGVPICIPEITDYEVRRGFERTDNHHGIAKLDGLKATLIYLPLTTAMMLNAARLWGETRKQGRTTAGDDALDGDVLLAAQTWALGRDAIIATTNLKHLSWLASAQVWDTITV